MKLDLMLPKNTFQNKVALVTGGGTGLGRGIAKNLAGLGATVGILSRKYDVLEKTAQELEKETASRIIPLAADVREPDAVKEAVNRLQTEAGLPTIVVNNAAGNFVSPFERLNAKGFSTIVDIVLKGTANITLEVGKRLIEEETPGVFLSITTTYAETGSGYVVPSAAAKAGVSAMVKSLGAEWGQYNIRHIGIAPGPIKTKGAFDRLDPSGDFEKQLQSNNPMGRFGEVEELANLAAYLTSDYASWFNGVVLPFDGGETAFNSGQFNLLSKVPREKWAELEAQIRQVNKKGSS